MNARFWCKRVAHTMMLAWPDLQFDGGIDLDCRPYGHYHPQATKNCLSIKRQLTDRSADVAQ
jgi:hypothetical protein